MLDEKVEPTSPAFGALKYQKILIFERLLMISAQDTALQYTDGNDFSSFEYVHELLVCVFRGLELSIRHLVYTTVGYSIWRG